MFKQIGIVGVGTIGGGIAQLAALAKLDVVLYDVNETILRRSVERIRGNLRKQLNLGKLTPEDFGSTMEQIRTKTNLPDLGHCDCIIESVIEDIRVKKDLFKHLDANTKTTAVLASTTSSLSITSIAALTRNPERIIGTHFLDPVDSTELVEVVKGHKTNAETADQITAFIRLLGKSPILVNDTPGFITTRVGNPFYSEALRLLGEHVAGADQIDRIAKAIGGFPAGPFEAMDSIGVDAVFAAAQSMHAQSFGEPRFRPHPILMRMTESGLLGKKSGKGFYTYDDAKE